MKHVNADDGMGEGRSAQSGLYLLLPALELLNQVIVPLGHLAELGVHAALEVDEVLPRLERVARVLVPLAHDLVEVAHRHLGHQRLLYRAAKNGLQPCIPALHHETCDQQIRNKMQPWGLHYNGRGCVEQWFLPSSRRRGP